jgi:hypothetical protein
MLPETPRVVFDGAAPVTVPVTSTKDPAASRAEPEIVPLTAVGATRTVRTSGVPVPGTRTVASSPERARSTLNSAVVLADGLLTDGLLIHTETDVQRPFWQVGSPVVDRVSARV